jgi:tetratricopeptide (TPR) repeat protein
MNLKMVNIVSLSIKGELLAFIFLFFFYGHSQNRNSDEIRKLNQQAIEFANKKNYEEARNLYNEILKLDPENRQAILHLMIVYEYEGK